LRVLHHAFAPLLFFFLPRLESSLGFPSRELSRSALSLLSLPAGRCSPVSDFRVFSSRALFRCANAFHFNHCFYLSCSPRRVPLPLLLRPTSKPPKNASLIASSGHPYPLLYVYCIETRYSPFSDPEIISSGLSLLPRCCC